MSRGFGCIKLVVVGDGTVGKSCLLITYTTGSFPKEEDIPVLYHPAVVDMECDDIPAPIAFWDTRGEEDYDRLRPLTYPGTDAFLVCFSIDNNRSYENIFTKYYPEIRRHCPKTPYILVGTKTDLRDSSTVPNKDDIVSKSEGEKMAMKIKAVKYVECSAKHSIGVKEVVEEAVRAGMASWSPSSIRRRKCTLL